MTHRLKGFTLIELIVVIGIIAILAGITIVAVNPARQFGQARNTQRRSDTTAVLNAIHQYAAENNGSFTALGLPACTAPFEVSAATFGTGDDTLASFLVNDYLTAIPADPQEIEDEPNNYTVCLDDGRVTVAAPSAEIEATIEVTR